LNICIAQYAADTHSAMNNTNDVINGQRFIAFLLVGWVRLCAHADSVSHIYSAAPFIAPARSCAYTTLRT
jgi:hypothetical protein